MKPDSWSENKDPFRIRAGWRGEMELFQQGELQHRGRSHANGQLDSECATCSMFTKHLQRLIKEGSEVLDQIHGGNFSSYDGTNKIRT